MKCLDVCLKKIYLKKKEVFMVLFKSVSGLDISKPETDLKSTIKTSFFLK